MHDAARTEQDRLIEWLADHDAPCPVCAYNLRGLTTDLCPECAAPLRLTIWSPQLNPAPWAVALIACALGAGFDGVVATLIGGGLIFAPPSAAAGAFPYTMLAVFSTAALATFGALIWVYTSRARWPRRMLAVQWSIAWTIFVAVGGAHAALGLTILAML